MDRELFIKRDRIIEYIINSYTDEELIELYNVEECYLVDRKLYYYDIAIDIITEESLCNEILINDLFDNLNIDNG